MKKCVIFFTALLIALIIAVWTDKNRQPPSDGDIALKQSVPSVLPKVKNTYSD